MFSKLNAARILVRTVVPVQQAICLQDTSAHALQDTQVLPALHLNVTFNPAKMVVLVNQMDHLSVTAAHAHQASLELFVR